MDRARSHPSRHTLRHHAHRVGASIFLKNKITRHAQSGSERGRQPQNTDRLQTVGGRHIRKCVTEVAGKTERTAGLQHASAIDHHTGKLGTHAGKPTANQR